MGKRGANSSNNKRNALPASRGGAKKDSGLPAYFKHRKMANMPQPGASTKHAQVAAAENSMQVEADASIPSLKHSLAGLNTKAQQQADEMDALVEKDAVNDDGSRLDASIRNRDSSSKAYARELKKVVEEAEVLIEVLDARDPLGCRSQTTERLILGADKRLVFVLSKIDLVPKSNVEAWLKYLRHEAPTLAFKASTQQQRTHLAHGAASFGSKPGPSAPRFGSTTSDAAKLDATSALSAGSEAVGAQALFQLLKVLARSTKASLTVGVFGAPNVGKSSLVNTLARARKCAVASTPGHTKVMQSVSIDDKLRLIDSPGVVFQDASLGAARALGEVDPQQAATLARAALLRNVIKVELVEDPIAPVEAILDRVEYHALCDLYGLGTNGFEKGNVHDFLLRVALRKGRIGRGGIADVDGAARNVLHDWNVGKIRYMTIPPAVHPSLASGSAPTNTAGPSHTTNILAQATALPVASAEAAHTVGASLVSSFSETFDLSALLGEADAEAFGSAALPDDEEFERVQRARDVEAARRANIPAPPPRRYAATEPRDEEEFAADQSAELSMTSTLGKRPRALEDESDDDSSSEEDVEEEQGDDDDDDDDAAQVNSALGVAPGAWEARTAVPAIVAPKVARPLPLTTRKRGRKDAPIIVCDEDLVVPDAAINGNDDIMTPSLPDWLERQHARALTARTTLPSHSHSSAPVGRGTHAELSTMFSSSELAHLAPSRGGARRKARKALKREGRIGGGIVEALEGAGLGTKADEAGENGGIKGEASRFAALGVEGAAKSRKKKKSKKAAGAVVAAAGALAQALTVDEDEEL